MKKTNLLLAAVIVLLVGYLLYDRTGQEAATDGQSLLPELSGGTASISSVLVTVPGGSVAATVEISDGQWVVREKNDYPADTEALSELIRSLAGATLLERKTANRDLHHRLGVEDLGSGDAGGIGVSLAGEGIERTIVLGDSSGNYRYARFADEDQSWLLDADPDVPDAQEDWLADEIVDIGSAQVRSVTITHADGEQITLQREEGDSSEFSVLEVPDGRELRYDTIANGIGNALSGLTLDDVMRHQPGQERSVQTVFQSTDGMELIIDGYERDGDTWFAFRAVQHESDAGSGETAAETGAEEGDEPAASDEFEASVDADALNARLTGWIYRVPGFKADLLQRRWEDLLKELEEPEQEDPAAE